MTVIGRFDRPDGRWYVDPLDSEWRAESVTRVLSSTKSKPWLEAWIAKLAAIECVDNLPDITALVAQGPGGRLIAIDRIKKASAVARDLKADVGTYAHNVVEALVLGGDIPSIPEHLEGRTVAWDGDDDIVTIDQAWLDTLIDGFLAFVTEFDVVFEMAEATVVNTKHRYAGTLDVVAVLRRLNNQRTLIDVKSGKRLDADMGEQLAAYRNADTVWLDALGDRAPMPRVDGAAVLHLRPAFRRGYRLVPFASGAAPFNAFLRRLRVLRDEDDQPKDAPCPLYPALPDGSQPPPHIEDVNAFGFNRYRSALIRAGAQTLTDLALFTADDLLQIPGVGPAAIGHIRHALDVHGLTLAPQHPAEVI